MGERCTTGNPTEQRRNYSTVNVFFVLLTLCAIAIVCISRYTSNFQTSVEHHTDERHVHEEHRTKVRHVQTIITGPYLTNEHYFLEPEIDQFYHYSRRNISTDFTEGQTMRTVDSSKYSYKITLLPSDAHTDGVFLRVDERYKGKVTSGGSCLYGVGHWAGFRSVCTSRDLYNGTYVVYCPRASDATCCKVTLHLQCVDFSAYTSLYRPLRNVIWKRRVCDAATRKAAEPRLGDSLLVHALRRDAARKNIVTWHYSDKDRKWSVRTSGTRWFRSLNRTTLCACVKRFGNVYMFGASHMRYKFNYLLEECYGRPTNLSQKHKSQSVGNLHYRWCSFADQFDGILSSNVTFKRNDLVLLQTGAHDLARRGVAASMGRSIRRFVDTLAVFSDSSNKRGFKLVLLTSPPCADGKEEVPTRGGRNSFAVAAFNQMLRMKATHLKVDVFDEFSVILPRQNSNVCGTHYICYDIRYHKITGAVGVTSTQLMMAGLCKLI